MKTILHLIHYAGNGGSEKYLSNIIKYLKPKGYEFIVVYSQEGPLIEELKQNDIKTIQIKMRHVFDLKAAYEVFKIVKKYKVDTIHAHFLRENFIGILSRIFRRKTKVIWTCHIMNEKTKLIKSFNKIFTKFNYKVIAVAQKVKEFLKEEGIDEDKILTIYNGIDTTYFTPKENSKIRKEFNIKENEFCILCVARLSVEKGQVFLLETLNYLKKEGKKHFKCILVGNGPEEEKLKKTTLQYDLQGEVIFAGYRKDVVDFLNATNIVVVPSQTEALSLSIAEALSCGIPIIGTRVGGNPEIILHKKNGLLMDYGDVLSFSKQITRLMEDSTLYSEFKIVARKTAVEMFSINQMIQTLEKIY